MLEANTLLNHETILVERAVSSVHMYRGNEMLICRADSMMGCKQC